MPKHTTSKFLEKTRRSTEIVNEATKFAYSKIQKWIDYLQELQEQAELFERQISISKPSNLMLDVDLLDLNRVIDLAFQKSALLNREVDEAQKEYNEFIRRKERANIAENDLLDLIEKKRQEIEKDMQKIDEELELLHAFHNIFSK